MYVFLYTKQTGKFLRCYKLHNLPMSIALIPLSQVNIKKHTFAASSTWHLVMLGDNRPHVVWERGWNLVDRIPVNFASMASLTVWSTSEVKRTCWFTFLDIRNAKSYNTYLCHVIMLMQCHHAYAAVNLCRVVAACHWCIVVWWTRAVMYAKIHY